MPFPQRLLRFAASLAAAGAAAVAATLLPLLARGQGFPAGRTVDRVACLADPERSYALYLPSSFDPGKTWPVLVLFDPGARGAVAIEAFRAAAEARGWVLAASNDSRNGPFRDSGLAAMALWADLRARLPVDAKRIYAAGFSGGARVASAFSRFIGRPIAGIIGCGAGLAAGVGPETLGASAYFGIAGLRDFNYGEMKELDRALDPAGPTHRFHYFEGPHAWPDAESCALAVAWLDVLAMKQGLRPADREAADATVRRDIEEGLALEAAGRAYWAVGRFEAAAGLAEGMGLSLPALEGLDGRIAELKARKEYGLFLEAEKKRDRKTLEFRQRSIRALSAVENPDGGGSAAVPQILQAAGISFLKKEARGKGALEDRALASRLLFDFCYAARGRASELYGQGNMLWSGAYFDLAIAACEEGLSLETWLYFNRACVAARAGDKKLALRHLAAAVEKGFADLRVLETDKDLDPVRGTAAFQALLARLRK
ncbi:MAG TPA: hypothetical protein P5119_04140 [Candidatus Aminicenantes bacterium]|nr:hypothetical protein [Candidatus Aminicenantes bacterium]HRY64514.1 hypothetical protein [Candidatus Aminicenantes bacterium]HRZ71427.1 hypothetical protein [Candidatus Aminicenantes bacterium]